MLSIKECEQDTIKLHRVQNPHVFSCIIQIQKPGWLDVGRASGEFPGNS